MSSFALKSIALLTMVIDHTGAVMPELGAWLRVVGRISFPIYAFLIAEGARHTRDIGRYFLRLAVFAVLSQIPFALAFHGGMLDLSGGFPLANISFLNQTNVFYTLALGVLAVVAVRALEASFAGGRRCAASVAAILFVAAAAEGLGTDYGALGVLMIGFTYLCPAKRSQLAVLGLGTVYLYSPLQSVADSALNGWFAGPDGWNAWAYAVSVWNQYSVVMLPAACLALILLAFYNGRRGPIFSARWSKVVKWGFYAVYPLHIIALLAIDSLCFQAVYLRF